MDLKEPKLDLSLTQIQAAIEDLDPRKNLQSIAASAADILAESELSTKWDDVILMLDSENISERLRLAAHIIFRAKLVLDEMDMSRINDLVPFQSKGEAFHQIQTNYSD